MEDDFKVVVGIRSLSFVIVFTFQLFISFHLPNHYSIGITEEKGNKPSNIKDGNRHLIIIKKKKIKLITLKIIIIL